MNTENVYTERDKTLKDMGYSSYQEYQRSDKWKCIRMKVLSRDNGTCQVCGKRADTVHHSRYTYSNLSGTTECFLHSVCKKCHLYVEFTEDGRKRPYEDSARLFASLGPKDPYYVNPGQGKKAFRSKAQKSKQAASLERKVRTSIARMDRAAAVELIIDLSKLYLKERK